MTTNNALHMLLLLLLLVLLLLHPAAAYGGGGGGGGAHIFVYPQFGVPPPTNTSLQSIQAAIDQAVDGDTINLFPGLFFGPGNVNIELQGKAVVIQALGEVAITCNAAPFSSAFLFLWNEGPDTVVDGVTVLNCTNLKGGGMQIGSGSSPTIQNCNFIECKCLASGGAIDAAGQGTLHVVNCTFIANEAPLGAGISSTKDRIDITGNTFMFNSGIFGGALYLAGTRGKVRHNVVTSNFGITGGSVYLTGCVNVTLEDLTISKAFSVSAVVYVTSSRDIHFTGMELSHCQAISSGWLELFNSADVLIENSSFHDNALIAVFSVSVASCPNVRFRNVVVRDNTAGVTAALFSRASHVTYANVLIQNITSPLGTGIMCMETSDCFVHDSQIMDNIGEDWGTIRVRHANILIADTLMKDNVNGRGGVLRIELDSNVTVKRSTFDGNRADITVFSGGPPNDFTASLQNIESGGAIHILASSSGVEDDSRVTLDSCTFKNNEAEGNGGAIFYDTFTGTLDGLDTCDFKGNRARGRGGAVYVDDTTGGGAPNIKKCEDCKNNKADEYGDDFASGPLSLLILKGPPKVFENLKAFETEVCVVDFFLNPASGQSVAVTPTAPGDVALIDASTAAVDENARVEFFFSLVADFGDSVKLEYRDQSGRLLSATSKTEAQSGCKDDEVTVDFPPGTAAFDVCVAASTQEADTTLRVFWLLCGILLGLLCVVAIILIFYIVFFNSIHARKYQMDASVPFQFDIWLSWSVLLGVLFGAAACFIQIPDPTDEACQALPWLWVLAGVLIATPLVTHIVVATWGGDRAGRCPMYITLLAIAVALVLNVIVLVVWTALDPMELGYDQDDADLTKQCEGENVFVYIGVLLGLFGAPILVGIIVSFLGEFANMRSRRWADHTQGLGFAVTHIAFVATACVVLMFLEYSSYTTRWIVQACGFLLCAWVLLGVLFAAPLYSVYSGDYAQEMTVMDSQRSGTRMDSIDSSGSSTPRGKSESARMAAMHG
eukprot:TRINITY_DN875_c1_g2_i1.p1 TRINITY_DN875_c1_g2~~TRINITY_DN875_c1_g2_i1.p1  ORF type:complete len:1005 (+),score=183.93 TRINITY_DN875_c1_g2_i1:77-3091(+)